jgi:hypothetical protein
MMTVSECSTVHDFHVKSITTESSLAVRKGSLFQKVDMWPPLGCPSLLVHLISD